LSFINRVKEAGRLIVGSQRVPTYRTNDLAKIVNFAVGRARAERNARKFSNEYTAAGAGRMRQDWASATETPYTELNAKQLTIVARSRDLYKNDSTYRGAINTIVDNAIGTGLWPKPKIKGVDGKLNTVLNKKIENLFNAYSQRGQWDARHKFPFVGDGQRMILKTVLLSGDAFLNAVPNTAPGAVIPVSWQMFEIDRLDNMKDIFKKNNTAGENIAQTMHGINIDKYGAEVSYWIKGLSAAINAKNIIHTCMVDRPEQYIGLPAAVAALADIYDKHDLLEDYVLKSRAIAKVLWFLSNENDTAPGEDDVDSSSIVELDSMSQMRGEKAPEPVKMPDSVSDTIMPLVKLLMHGITSGIGTSYTTVSRDMDGVNFAASKFIDIQEWRHYTALKDWFVYDMCNPFWERFIQYAAASGSIPEMSPAIYAKNPAQFLDVQWVGNGKQDVDPLKDMSADVMGLEGGVLTLTDVLEKRGKDIDEHLDTLVEENDKLKSRGLSFSYKLDPAVTAALIAENPDEPAKAPKKGKGK
jgi:lambda family phage portal protein